MFIIDNELYLLLNVLKEITKWMPVFFPESPFEPGHHVSPDNFKGRYDDIVKIIRYVPKIINPGGGSEHFFVI